MTSTSSASSSPRSRKYDVFLSFRGEDTRNGIVSHLYKELKQRRLDPFLDEPEIRTGHAISDELVNAINHSRASIVVISEKYATSSWVLNELLEILKCKKNNDQIVVPVFYQVDPSHVRKQTESFGRALEEHETKFRKGKDTLELARNIEKIQDWKKAMTKIASIKGWDSRDRSESELVEQICRDIWEQLHSMLPDASSDLVGMGSRMAMMEHLLKLRSKKVRMVGILGMGGIGKTTIATAVYEKIKRKFDMHCIIYDVKKVCKERNVSRVQELLLSKLFNTKEGKIGVESETSNVIKEMLHQKKVLIVLDDLDHLEQLRSFAKETSWFGPCSRIIITTRDEKVLIANQVKHVYKVGYLGHRTSLRLFNQFAFRQTIIPNGFKDLSDRAVSLARGLPLALKVLGSHLYGENEFHWESHLQKLERFLHPDIMEVLKTSYDSLDADTQVIFRYVACDLYYSLQTGIELSDACGYYTESELNILAQKSLISYRPGGAWISMHDLVQQMGRNITRGEFRRRPETYKMLWDSEDICQVLSDSTGTEAIEGILLNPSEYSYCHAIHISPEAFKGMSNLKFLYIACVGQLIFPDGLEWLPCALNYLYWHEYPFITLPLSFLPINLVVLRISSSHLEKLWEGVKPLVKLKVMDLSYSTQLKILPDLSNATSLEDLYLRGCKSLVEVSTLPPNLKSLNLKGCSQLKDLDCSQPLVKLKTMDLSHCEHLKRTPDLSKATNLKRLFLILSKSLFEFPKLANEAMISLRNLCIDCSLLPDNLSSFNSLTMLEVKGIELRRIPSSIMCLRNLEYLRLEGRDDNVPDDVSWDCPSLSALCVLADLSLINLNLQKIPDDFGRLHKLSSLKLSGNNFESLPVSIKNLSSLGSLTLRNCKRLKTLPELPRQVLFEVCATDCVSLEQIHVDSLPGRSEFTNCFKLENFTQLIVESMGRNRTQKAVYLTGSEIPEWFGNESNGIFETPRLVRDAVGFLSCLVLPWESLKTFRIPNDICDYRFISKTQARDVHTGNSYFFRPFDCTSAIDIPQRDHLLVWYDAFKDVFEADSNYDQVVFDFSVYDGLEGEATRRFKPDRCGVQLYFREPEPLIGEP